MAEHYNPATLKEMIRLKEMELKLQGQLLKLQYKEASHALKPSNVIREAADQILKPSETRDRIIDTGLGVLAGIASKKLITRSSNKPLVRLAGNLAEVIITGLIARRQSKIRDTADSILGAVFGEPDEETKGQSADPTGPEQPESPKP